MRQYLVEQVALASILEYILEENFPEFVFPCGFNNHNETTIRA